MKLKKIKARLAEIQARQAAIDERQSAIEKASTDGKFSPESRAEYDTLGREYGELKGEASSLEDQKKLAKKAKKEAKALADKAAADAAAAAANGRTPPALIARRTVAGAGAPPPTGTTDPNWARSLVAQGTGMEFRLPPRIQRVTVTPRNFRGTINGMSAEERAYRMGMYVLASLNRDLPNRFSFPHAVLWVQDNMGDVLNIAAGEYEGSTGAHFLVPEEFGTDMISLRERFGVARRLFKMVPMASDTRVDPRRKGGLTANFVQQNAAGTESNMQWDEVRLTARDLMVLARYSNQLNADAVINIGDTLSGEIAYAFTQKEDDCAFNGDTTLKYGGIAGVRPKMTNWDGLGTTSPGLQSPATTGSWANLVLNDFELTAGLLPQYADGPNCVWVCHRTFYYGVMLKLELAAGGVQQYQVAQGDRSPRPLFLGYPVEWSQVWPSATAATSVVCALGDFSLGASFGDRQQDSIAFSEHASVGGQNVFERNQIAIRGVERFDINVHDVGGPSGGNTTLGPIVALTT
jgi:HK97 family phage major capsid protein